MSEYAPKSTRSGGVIQGAMPKVTTRERRQTTTPSARGLLVRGIVMSTYVYNEDNALPNRVTPQRAAYADVFVYSSVPGMKMSFLPRVLVSQERAGLHEGDIWVPRATTMDISGTPLDHTNIGKSDPFDWDGDHVLIGFMDDSYSLPVILKQIPHPNADKGKTTGDAVGRRLRLVTTDKQPRQVKHRGSHWGVDSDGNWLLDLTKAHSGVYNTDGTESDPPEDGNSGNFTVRVQKGAAGKIVGPNDELIEINAAGRVLLAATVGGQTVELNPDNTIVIDSPNAASGGGSRLEILADGSLDFEGDGGFSGNASAIFRAFIATLDAEVVSLGHTASEAAMQGDKWQALHQTYDQALLQLTSGLASTMGLIAAKLVPAPVPGDAISTALLNLNTLLTAMATAQAALTASPPAGVLSESVILRP